MITATLVDNNSNKESNLLSVGVVPKLTMTTMAMTATVMTTRVMTPNNNDNNRDDTNNDNNNGDDNNVEDNNNDNNNGDDDNLLGVGVVSVPKLSSHPLRHSSTLRPHLLQLTRSFI